MEIYDLIIVGGGPAGLSAGVYGGRARLKTLILEKGSIGGQAYTTREIVNYPGFYEDITGPDLTKNMTDHAIRFGVEIVKDEVLEVDLSKDIKEITTKKGSQYFTKAVILAAGSQPRLLNIPGENEMKGMGVSYCATCDAEFYEDLDVVVVGNGDAAIEEAIYITKFAKKVYIIVIHDEGIVDCNKISAAKAFKNEKIDFIWNSTLSSINGNGEVEAVSIKNIKTGEVTDLDVSGVFIYVGMNPGTEFLKGKVDLDDRGYIIADENMETSVSGVFAAGDVRIKQLRQVVTAANDGAIAAVSVEHYLTEEEDFRNLVLNSEEPVFLLVWNPSLDGNIETASSIEKTILDLDKDAKIVKVDVSRKKRIAKGYGITQVPSLLLIKEGKVIEKITTDFESEINKI